jgi:xanthine dehydrogenase accessory factor
VIGSRKRLADRRDRLAAAGVRPEDLDRLRSPIGLDLGGRAPAEIALSIMAEIVAMRYGGKAFEVREKPRVTAASAPSRDVSPTVSAG